MLEEIKLLAVCFVAFLVGDAIWLGFLTKKFYVRELRPIGRISGDKFEPLLWAAVVVYLALSFGGVQFVLPRISAGTPWLTVFGIGALFGLVVYATYDFTNYSTLKNWKLALTFTDVAWGTFLSGLVALIARFVRAL